MNMNVKAEGGQERNECSNSKWRDANYKFFVQVLVPLFYLG